jgi:hypothetical protein
MDHATARADDAERGPQASPARHGGQGWRLGLLVVDGHADLDPVAGPGWVRMRTLVPASR